jgi:hypothetical protein
MISHFDSLAEAKFDEPDEEICLVLQYLEVGDKFVNEMLDFRESVKDEVSSFFNSIS